jgi:hypothetical protein
MLVNQMLMALFLGIGNLGVPSLFLHDFPGPENGIFKMVMTVDVAWIFNQVGIIDIPPPITITDTRDVPGGVADGTGYELAEFYGFWHDGLLSNAKKATCLGDGVALDGGKMV